MRVVVADDHPLFRNGLTAAIAAAAPGVAVLVLTMVDDDASVFAAVRAGARGYVLKGAEPAEILRSVLVVADGEVIFGRSVATRVLRFFAAPAARQVLPFPDLTARERQVLEQLAGGAGNAAIAARLHLSEKTVRNLVSSVLGKLQVADRAAAVARARDAGIGPG